MNENATFRYGQLNTKYLKVDTDYQRVPDPKRVKTIAEHFNPLKVNPIKVSHRDNAYWILFSIFGGLNFIAETYEW